MKRKSLLFALLVALFMPWAANAQTRETQTFDFEDGTIPSTWTNDANHPWVVVSESQGNGHSGTYCIKSGNSGVNSSSSTISATFNFNDDGTISFLGGCWGEGTSTAWDKCIFSIDGAQQFSYGARQTWETYSFNVTAGEHTFTWSFTKDSSVAGTGDAFFVDDIVVNLGEVPACPKPTGLTASYNGDGTATASWTSEASQFNIDVNGSVTEGVTNPYTFNVEFSTTYAVSVQADCGSEQSGWTNPVSFTTPCAAITTLPWNENFDTYTGSTGTTAPSGYPNDELPMCWQFLNRSETTGTYPQVFLSSNSTYAVSGNCLFFKSSSTTPLYAILPAFAQDIANLQLTFTYRNEGTSTSNGTLIVGYMTDPTDASTFETVLTCDRTTTKTEMEVTFAGAPAGSYIAFMYQGGSSNNYYLGIDNVVVESAPTCLKPTDLAQTHTNHSATLSWTAGNEGQNAWQIAYSTTSFDPNAAEFDLTTVEVIDVEDNPYTFDKTLEANTHYYMYVRGNCGDEDYSKWVGIDFTTGAAAPSPTITTVDEITPVSAVLRWTAAGGDFLESYDIYYSQTSGQPTEESEIQYTGIDADFTSYIIRNLTEGYWYVYMRAYHGETDGYSSWTPVYGYGFQVPEACPKPTNLIANNPTPNSITLSWKEGASWQSTWTVAYATVEGFDPNDAEVATYVDAWGPVDENGTFGPFEVNGLESNTTYYFRVKGNCGNEYGQSEWNTTEVSATTLVACPVPTDLVATAANTSATLSWNGYSDSYTVQYRTAGGYGVELVEGFESGSMPAGWTIEGDNQVSTKTWQVGVGDYSTATGTHSGDYNALIKHNSDGNETYLITPALDFSVVSEASLNLWYINRSWAGDIDEFGVYYRVNGGEWNELFSTTEAHSTWTELNLTLTGLAANTQIGFKCYDNYGYGIGLDDITILGGEYNEPGEWITYNDNVTTTTATIEGLEFGTKYDAQVKANCGDEYCDYVTFTTNALKTFTTEGDWSVAANWTPAGIPTSEDVVSIEAAATITDIAYASEININGGSITIADGGQLVHNNTGVAATVKKTINGVGEANWNADNNGGYYFIANPLTSSVYPEEAGLITEDENYDLYDWAAGYELEWRNYKDAQFSLSYYNTPAYLYANMNTVELAFSGTVRSSENRVSAPVYVSNNEFGTWNLIGNPFVCNAYLVDNAGVALPFYKMNNDGNGYDAVTGEAIAPVTGIFYEAPANGSVYFTREAPAKSGSLNMVVSQGRGVVDNAIIRFGEGQQMSKFNFREGSTKVYMPQDGKDYAIVNANNEGEMPVSFKAENNGSYTLSFNAEEVSFNYLHLIDNMTGADVDLLSTPSYSFEARTTDYANRFRLVFATGNNSNEDNFAFFSNGSLVINNEGNATVQVIDVTGRNIKSESITGCANVNFDAVPGVYMVRLINSDNMKVQKVVK